MTFYNKTALARMWLSPSYNLIRESKAGSKFRKALRQTKVKFQGTNLDCQALEEKAMDRTTWQLVSIFHSKTSYSLDAEVSL